MNRINFAIIIFTLIFVYSLHPPLFSTSCASIFFFFYVLVFHCISTIDLATIYL